MKFKPCMDLCSYDGTHCSGCGRSHEEIMDTKQLVMFIVDFIQTKNYENGEEFMNAISKSVLKKIQKRA